MMAPRSIPEDASACAACREPIGAGDLTVIDERLRLRSHMVCWGGHADLAFLAEAGAGPAMAVPPARRTVAAAERSPAAAGRFPSPRERSEAPPRTRSRPLAEVLIVTVRRRGERARSVALDADDAVRALLERLSALGQPEASG